VLALSFPLHPPGRPEKSRLPELQGARVPTLVVQGERDPFGMPPDGPGRTVARIAGDHSLKSDVRALRDAVGGWLDLVLGG
jgi:predicted alpha/beta-hydrolase family hydrolase